jgi:hypothetical protein
MLTAMMIHTHFTYKILQLFSWPCVMCLRYKNVCNEITIHYYSVKIYIHSDNIFLNIFCVLENTFINRIMTTLFSTVDINLHSFYNSNINLFNNNKNEPRRDHYSYHSHNNQHVPSHSKHRIFEDRAGLVETYSVGELYYMKWRKFIELIFHDTIKILGAVCCFLVGWNFWSYTPVLGNSLLFFLIVASACLIGTFCLLVSCLFSLSTGG